MTQEKTTKDLEDKLFSMLSKQLRVSRDTLTRDSTLESVGLDSLETFEFIFLVEDTFGIQFEQDTEMPKTLGEVFDRIAVCMNKTEVQG